jgi:hypothetical protein
VLAVDVVAERSEKVGGNHVHPDSVARSRRTEDIGEFAESPDALWRNNFGRRQQE